MLQDGHTSVPRPVRGTPGWWQELGKAARPSAIATTCKKKRKKRGRSSPFIRSELVERVRREIAAGTYETPEKWQAALDRLLDSLS